MSKKERLVAAIENGTVIDHIPSEKSRYTQRTSRNHQMQ